VPSVSIAALPRRAETGTPGVLLLPTTARGARPSGSIAPRKASLLAAWSGRSIAARNVCFCTNTLPPGGCSLGAALRTPRLLHFQVVPSYIATAAV